MSEFSLPTQQAAKNVSSPFQWKTRTGVWLQPSDMDTNHLMHTVLMIWNHTMPIEMRFTPYRQYSFGNLYTNKYLKLALLHMIPILVTRPDIHERHKAIIRRMVAWTVSSDPSTTPGGYIDNNNTDR